MTFRIGNQSQIQHRNRIMNIQKNDTALVVIDPQNDVLSEKGVSWPLVGASIKENNTVENLARLFQAAKEQGFGVFISPHYLFPADQAWQFAGALERSEEHTSELQS